MRKRSKYLVSNRRWSKPRPKPRVLRPEGRFALVVVAIAVVAFAGTMMWPRAVDLISAQASTTAYDFACDVAFVNDGDTLRCADGTRVRLHAISARETDNTCSPGHPCPTASAATSTAALTRLAGSRITCIRTGRSYERVTAICHNASGTEINCAMVESGFAAVWDRFNRQQPICRA